MDWQWQYKNVNNAWSVIKQCVSQQAQQHGRSISVVLRAAVAFCSADMLASRHLQQVVDAKKHRVGRRHADDRRQAARVQRRGPLGAQDETQRLDDAGLARAVGQDPRSQQIQREAGYARGDTCACEGDGLKMPFCTVAVVGPASARNMVTHG